MKIVALVVGVVGALLGGLWLLQGLGWVHIKPILCVADCKPLEGASPTWAGIGLVVFAAGVAAIVHGLRRKPR